MKSVRDNLGAMQFSLNRIFHLSVLAFLCLIVSLPGYSQNIPPAPNPPRLVNDFAHVMSPGEVDALENKLDRYNDSTSTQIAIVTVETLDGADVGSYASELGEKWGVGTKKNHNGIVILMAKKEHKATIRTGYGVEEKLGSIICDRIVKSKLAPNFKAGNFYAGFDAATTEIIQRLAGTFEDKGNPGEGGGKGIPFWVIIAIIVFLLFILPRFFGGGGNGGTFGGGGFAGGLIGGFLGSGGFGGGGGSDDGGGFGGFGGGGFSGGGASGDW
jgi:uncharacterized protein